jgi:small-conductance mechanosensitive channel
MIVLAPAGRALAQDTQGPPAPVATPAETTPAGSVSAPALPASPDSAPVIVNGKTLFTVFGNPANPAAQRAADIAQRITRLTKRPSSQLKGLTAQVNDGWTDIVLDGEVIASLSNADAAAAGRTGPGLAQEVIERIQKEAGPAPSTNWRELTRDIVYAGLATLAFGVALRVLWYFHRRLQHTLERLRGEKLRSLRIQNLELLSKERIAGFISILIRLAALAVSVAFVAVYLSTVSGFFPQTRGYASALWGFTLAPFVAIGSAVLGQIPNLFFMTVILLVAYYAQRLIAVIFAEIGEGRLHIRGFQRGWTAPTLRLARVLLVAVTLVAIFPYIPGSRSPAFQGVSLFLGFLLSMASSGAISNIISGLMLTYTGALNIGDRVQIGNAEGVVTETTMLVTRVRTDENINVAIPNTSVLTSNIFNHSARIQMRSLEVRVKVNVGFDTPWREVESLLHEAAKRTSGLLSDPPPVVKLENFAGTYITYGLYATIESDDPASDIQSELHKNILDVFAEQDISLLVWDKRPSSPSSQKE